jgi:hypothetical protein
MGTGVKFIRKNGHVIPIRGKSGASVKKSTKPSSAHATGRLHAQQSRAVNGGLIGALVGGFAAGPIGTLVGGGVGYAVGSSTFGKVKKGESNISAAKRMAKGTTG